MKFALILLATLTASLSFADMEYILKGRKETLIYFEQFSRSRIITEEGMKVLLNPETAAKFPDCSYGEYRVLMQEVNGLKMAQLLDETCQER